MDLANKFHLPVTSYKNLLQLYVQLIQQYF